MIDAGILMSFDQMMLGEEGGEAAAPNVGGLTQTIQRLLQMTNVSRKIRIFKVGQLKHVEFLIECPM